MDTAANIQSEAMTHIAQACRRGSVAGIAVETPTGWRFGRTRLLGCHPRRGVLWCEQPAPAIGAMPMALSADQRVAMRFTSADRRITFQSAVGQLRLLEQGDDSRAIVEIPLPEEILCENQRRSFRVRIADDAPFKMILWTLDMQRRLDPDEPVRSYGARVVDLSIGGAAITDVADDCDWQAGEHVGLELYAPGEEPLLLFAEICRITRPKDRPRSYGILFLGAETPLKTFAVQEALSRLVNEQQRRQLSKRIS